MSHPFFKGFWRITSLNSRRIRLRTTALPKLLLTENPYLLALSPLGNAFTETSLFPQPLPDLYTAANWALFLKARSLVISLYWRQPPSALEPP